MNNITKLKGLLKAGARLNKWRVYFAFPEGLKTETPLDELSLLCKTASAPAKSIGVIETSVQGRKLRLPGETTFDGSWTATFHLKENHNIRRDLLNWMKACDNFQGNTHSGDPARLLVDLKICQLDSMQNEVVTYVLHGCFPSNVTELSYANEEQNAIAEVSCTFQYTHWTVMEDDNKDNPTETPGKPAENILAEDI